MKIRITQLRQRLDDWQLPVEELAARALRVKREDILWARLARKSVDARDKGDVHFTLTLECETARPVRLPRNAEAIESGLGDDFSNQKVVGGTPPTTLGSPASIQPAPSAVAAGPGRRTGGWAGRWRRAGARSGRAAAAGVFPVAAHADHQVPAPVHAQQHLGHLPRAAGVLDPHAAALALVREPPRLPSAAEHRHAHAGPVATLRPDHRVQRHAFIHHIHITFPTGAQRAGYRPVGLWYHYATGKRCVPIDFKPPIW